MATDVTHVPAIGEWVHNDAMPNGDIYVTEIDGSMFWGRIWWRDAERLAARDSLHPLNSAHGWERVDSPPQFKAPTVLPSPAAWRGAVRQVLAECHREYTPTPTGELIADRIWALLKHWR